MGAHKSADGRIRYSCGKCGTTIWEWFTIFKK
jgi:ribosomal protein S27AE